MFNETIENHLVRPIADAELPGYVNPDVEPDPVCHNCKTALGVDKCTAGCGRFVCERCMDDDGECPDCNYATRKRRQDLKEARGDIMRERAVDAIYDCLNRFSPAVPR